MKNNIVILASASQRRHQILRECGIRHKVIVSRHPEKFHHAIHPRALVLENAVAKAAVVAKKVHSGVVLGCDTLVLHNNRAVGKPKNKNEAARLLRSFSGKQLHVFTGLCLIDVRRKKQASAVAVSSLRVANLKASELPRYLKLLAPYDKAGGFSIEGAGAILFDDVCGSYYNILGLPMGSLAKLFKKLGLTILDFISA